jgi:hypothetical protein
MANLSVNFLRERLASKGNSPQRLLALRRFESQSDTMVLFISTP